MTQYRGFTTLDDAPVPLTVGLEDEKLSLHSGDVSLGEWPPGEYLVIDLGEGTFVIEAEKSSIPFQPDDPNGFARVIGTETTAADEHADAEIPDAAVPDAVQVGPPPKTSTLIAFYVLVLITAALGVWAVISVF